MLEIKKKDFEILRRKYPDSISKSIMRHEWQGKVCEKGDYMAFEGTLTGDWSRGSCLIFEHIHFEIV